ncbi:MAG: glucosyl-3-phosphoglycerate synthase [Verrucomicrobiaceae bacterium]|nr:MAG: glucosyl-3-phosphoglycerate synthase [Verrucomicrobiaceae bacterium]
MMGGIFHHSAFTDARRLTDLKTGPVSVCIPTLDEEGTIGDIVSAIRRELMERVPLVDELLVIDSGSTDRTIPVAAEAGATVLLSADIAPGHGSHRGKGENLWKALFAAKGEIICYVDGDIANFHPGFITGLLGPLLSHREIQYVKAHYERPLANGVDFHRTGGGRVSEILVRPLLSLFYPQLTTIFQPLSGEYAARRGLLEELPFPTGYGVEIAHLIDLLAMGKMEVIAQVDLDQRIHRNRGDGELGKMSFSILRTILHRLERDGKITLHQALEELHRSWEHDSGTPMELETLILEIERPPIASL